MTKMDGQFLRYKAYGSSLLDKAAGPASSKIFRAMATLILGSGIAKVISLISIPIITRLYSPDDFGILAVFTAAVAILAPLLTLSYHLAVPLPRQASVAGTLVWLAFFPSAFCAFVLTAILWTYNFQILSALSVSALIPYWWLIVIGIFGFASFETLSMWATRERAFGQLSRLNVRQALFGNLVKIAAGVFGAGPIGLMVGAIVGKSSGTLTLFAANRAALEGARQRLTIRRLIAVAKRYSSFPLLRFPANQLTALGQHFPVVFISTMYGTEIAGQFGLTMLAFALPVTLLAASMSKAYYGEVAQLTHSQPGAAYHVTKEIVWRMLAISLVPTVFIVLWGPHLFALIFGDEWSQAGEFARYIAPLLLVQIPGSSIHFIFAIRRKEKTYLYFSAQRFFLITLICGLALSLRFTDYQFVYLYSAAMTLHYGIVVIKCIQVSAERDG